MEPQEVLDGFVTLGLGQREEDGDTTTYWFTLHKGKMHEGDTVAISRKLMEFLGCKDVSFYLKDSGDENDVDQIAFTFTRETS